MREPGSGTYKAVATSFAKNGINIEGLNTLLTLGNSEAIALSVQEGIGVGICLQTGRKIFLQPAGCPCKDPGH